MSIARVRSYAFSGIEAVPVDVQVQISSGIPAFLVVGLADKAVAEARERVRAALTEAEAALSGGVSPRISPFPDLRDCAGLLQRAGFALPVADSEDITLAYASPFALLQDLRSAGETNAVALRTRRPPPRDLFPAALAGLPSRDGRHPATLRLAMLTGWAPAPTQPMPAKRGSGTISLADVLGDE